jgi:hypothetical protein
MRALVVVFLCSLSSARAEDVIANGFSTERYQGISERNPFQWVAQPKAIAVPNFAENLVLTSWLNQGGREVVYVQNKDTHESQRITVEPNANGLRIISISSNPDPQKVAVVLSNGTEEGTVQFNTEGAPVFDDVNEAGTEGPLIVFAFGSKPCRALRAERIGDQEARVVWWTSPPRRSIPRSSHRGPN